MGQGTNRRCLWGHPRFFGLIHDDLLDFAEFQFDLQKPDKDGITKRDHLTQVAKQTGRDELLAGPPLPEVAAYLWETFLELHRGRSYGMGGGNPLTYEGILAWCNLSGVRLSWGEVEIVKMLDAAWLKTMNGDG